MWSTFPSPGQPQRALCAGKRVVVQCLLSSTIWLAAGLRIATAQTQAPQTQESSQPLAATGIAAERVSPQAIDASQYVACQSGDLPIIISAPHGGVMDVPGVSPRTGEGLEKGSSGFFAGRDTGTEELAQAVVSAIKKRFGKPPYFVISRAHRKYLDPNRPATIAYEDQAVAPIYQRYHEHLAEYSREVTNRFHGGVLLDLHGQSSRRDTVFRGTKNGMTVTRLRNAFGAAAHEGPQSLFGLLAGKGWIVHPMPLDGTEQSGFTGGYIVQSHGSHQGLPIDAMQLEFGADYRMPSRRERTAAELASALADYAQHYLHCSVPALENPSENQPVRIDVAVFVDEGVSSTSRLFEVLDSDARLRAHSMTAADIRAGKLDRYEVLIHPGGSGSGQGRALGEEGREKIRQFVRSGRGLVGICAGAYLASADYEWSLHVLDAKVVDRAHWNRGHGTVGVEMTAEGRQLLGRSSDHVDIYYHQGPLLAPAGKPDIPDFTILGKYAGEIVDNGAPRGVMPGTTAIARGAYGQGRVICFSPHPEKTPNMEGLLLDGIHWSAGEKEGEAPGPAERSDESTKGLR